MNHRIVIVITCAVLITGLRAGNLQAEEQPKYVQVGIQLVESGRVNSPALHELSATVSSLKFPMPPKGLHSSDDGVQGLADVMGLTRSELLSAAQYGITARGEKCPTAPRESCDYWYEAGQMIRKLFVIYSAEFLNVGALGPTYYPECIDLAHFASKVYEAKAVGSSLGDILSTIKIAADGNSGQTMLLQGVAVAIFADGSLDRAEAFQSADSACQAMTPHG